MKTAFQIATGYEGCQACKVRKLPALETAALILRYCLAARRDEKNGFRFTAAMEWQEAAYLCFQNGLLANLCWRNWERIVRLPRNMAEPIMDQAQTNARTSQPFVPAPTANERPLLVPALQTSA